MKRSLFFGAVSALVLVGSASAVNLWDNGPLITHPGGGAGGADFSMLQTDLAMNTLGFGHQFASDIHIADDFEVGAGGWNIDSIDFFAYQTNSGNQSTITGLYVRIWDGSPDDGGSNVVWGDLTTNLMVSTAWANMYRGSALDATNRPVMQSQAAIGTQLAAGTYWLEWMSDGTGASGPWAPPISILGQTTTGNGLQYYLSAWGPANDSGTLTQQGFPFLIDGSVVPAPGALALLGLAGLARRRRR